MPAEQPFDCTKIFQQLRAECGYFIISVYVGKDSLQSCQRNEVTLKGTKRYIGIQTLSWGSASHWVFLILTGFKEAVLR